jgi:hypothetical protein
MSHQVAIANSKGDKCPIMTMKIYGRTLVYFWGEIIPLGGFSIIFPFGTTITLSVEKILKRGSTVL